MLVAHERFLSYIVDIHGQHPVFTDGGSWYPPQAGKFLKLVHHLHLSFEKSLIERTIKLSRVEPNVSMITFMV